MSLAVQQEQLADLLEQNSERYARLITEEVRKTITSARAEIEKCASTSRWLAHNAPFALADQTVTANARIRYEPLGLVLGVMPWNFPFWQVVRFAVPALLAGNSVMVKHSPLVPRCAAALEELFVEAGFRFTTAALPIEDERVRAVVVTASTETGAEIAALAGRHLKKVVLELGGSDAFIVMPSANLDTAVAEAVRSRLHCNGQACTAAKRFIVHNHIADEFERRFVAAMNAVRCGDPFDERTQLGPLINAEAADRLERQMQSSIAAGARHRTGRRIDETLFSPIVLTNVPIQSAAAQEETFGPLAAVFRARDLSHALEIANSTRYGLGASVWTTDRFESERCINELEVGQVFVNAAVHSDPRLPFGGTKASGFGRELGVAGLRELTNVKTIVVG